MQTVWTSLVKNTEKHWFLVMCFVSVSMIALNLTYCFLDARKYWQLLISNERHCVLAILATRILTIVPQAAEEECIFSCLSLNNTQTRSCLAVPTLEKIYQIKNFLQGKKSRPSNHALQYNEEEIAIMEESVDNDTAIVNTPEMSDMVEVLQGDRQQQTEVDLEDLEIYFQDMVEIWLLRMLLLMDYTQCSALNIPFFLTDLPILKLLQIKEGYQRCKISKVRNSLYHFQFFLYYFLSNLMDK
jgi:hypothetical protein